MSHMSDQPRVENEPNNLLGIIAILTAMAAFICNDSIVKLNSERLPISEIMFLRGLFSTAILLAWVVVARGFEAFKHCKDPVVIYRSLLDFVGSFCFLSALYNMPIANATAILQSMPLLMTVFAFLFLRAPVGWRRWLAVAIGFIGVLLIVQPTVDGFNPASGWALAAVVLVTARDLITRNARPHTPSVLITAAAAFSVTVGGAILGWAENWETWVEPTQSEWIAVVAAALCLVVAYHLVVVAMRIGEIAAIAPFRYTIILWSLLSGFLFWGDVPNALALFGMTLVIAMGIYTFYRERKVTAA